MEGNPKCPAMKHARVEFLPNDYSFEKCGENRGFLGLIRDPAVVVDVDEKSWARSLEECFEPFRRTVSSETEKGQHYYFRVTETSKKAGISDSARKFSILPPGHPELKSYPGTENVLPVDIKTGTKTGTRGCIAMPPFGKKTWKRHPRFGPADDPESSTSTVLPIPDDFVEFLVDRRIDGFNSSTSTQSTGRTDGQSNNGQADVVEVRALLGLMSHHRMDSYQGWIETGMAAKRANDSFESLQAWKAASSRSAKYNERQCEIKWSSFGGSSGGAQQRGLNIGSLHRWASLDNPAGYADFLKKRNEERAKPQVVKRGDSTEALQWRALDVKVDPVAIALSSISAVKDARLLSAIKSVKYAVVRGHGLEAALRLDPEDLKKALTESKRGCPTCSAATLDDNHWSKNSPGPKLRLKLQVSGEDSTGRHPAKRLFLDYLCSSESCLKHPKPLVTKLLGNPPAAASASIPLTLAEATAIADVLQRQCDSILATPHVHEIWRPTPGVATHLIPTTLRPSFIEDSDTGERTLLPPADARELDLVASLTSEAEILKNMLETEMKAARECEATRECRQEVRDVYDRVCSFGIQEVAGDGISALFESDSIQHRVFPVTTSCYTRPAVARSSVPTSSSARQSKRDIARDQWDHADNSEDIEYPGPLVPNLVLRGRLSDVLGAYDKSLTSAYTEWRVEQNSHGDLTLTGTGKNTRQKEYVIEVDNYVKDGGNILRLNAAASQQRHVVTLARNRNRPKIDQVAKAALDALNSWMAAQSTRVVQEYGLQQLLDALKAIRSSGQHNGPLVNINISGNMVGDINLAGNGGQRDSIDHPCNKIFLAKVIARALGETTLKRMVPFMHQGRPYSVKEIYYCEPLEAGSHAPLLTSSGPTVTFPDGDDGSAIYGVWQKLDVSEANNIVQESLQMLNLPFSAQQINVLRDNIDYILYQALCCETRPTARLREERAMLKDRLDMY
jgi:hypothetical protein